MGKNYMDVDIAEQNALGYIAGLATNGAKAVLGAKGSYIQRGYDQILEDIAINNAPATMLIFVEGISSFDATHLGIFDIPLISNIPNIVYLAPTSKEEYLAMLDWSVEQNEYPVAIRVPFRPTVSTGEKDSTDYSIKNSLSEFKPEMIGKEPGGFHNRCYNSIQKCEIDLRKNFDNQ